MKWRYFIYFYFYYNILLEGTPTTRQVSKRQVSKCPVSKRLKRQVYKCQVYKKSGLQKGRFTKRQVFKTSGCKTTNNVLFSLVISKFDTLFPLNRNANLAIHTFLFNKYIKLNNRTFWSFYLYEHFETGRFETLRYETWRFLGVPVGIEPVFHDTAILFLFDDVEASMIKCPSLFRLNNCSYCSLVVFFCDLKLLRFVILSLRHSRIENKLWNPYRYLLRDLLRWMFLCCDRRTQVVFYIIIATWSTV